MDLILNDGKEMRMPLLKPYSSIVTFIGTLSVKQDKWPKIRDLARLQLQRRFLSLPLSLYFNNLFIDIINVISYKYLMRDESFFLHPVHEWQRRYEALRASYVERLPARIVAERFGYSLAYIHLLRHLFAHQKIDFSEPVPEGKTNRRRIDAALKAKICNWREHRLSAGEITALLSEEGVEVSVRTIERVLAEEGYPRLPRRSRLKLGLTVKGASVPAVAQKLSLGEMPKSSFESEAAGGLLFAPFIEQLNLSRVVQEAGLPGTKTIPALSYFLSFLALKLIGTERYAHLPEHTFDPGLGLFAGLNVLPKCTAMSTYSYGLDAENVIAEAVKFFNLNALSSPILVKVHFDVIMTMIADTLYSLLARKLRGFENCDASKIYRLFVKGKAKVSLSSQKLTVTFPRRAHNPILRSAPWHQLPQSLSWLNGAGFELRFK